MKPVTDLVWIQTAFLGDIILTTGAIRLAQAKWPHVKQHIITTSVGKAALTGTLPENFTLTVFEKRQHSFWRAYRDLKRQFAKLPRQTTVILRAHRSLRSTLLAKLLGYDTITFEESTWSFLASKRVPRVSVFHEAVRIALLLGPLGARRDEIVAARPCLNPIMKPLNPDLVALADTWQGEIVAIAPGSVWGTKRWLPEGFATLTKLLLDDNATRVVLLIGSQEEKKYADQIAEFCGHSARVFNLCGRTRLPDLGWLYPKLALVISNDSSPIHYAAAYNIPTVAIFGATVPELGFGPLANKSVIVETAGLNCRPCSEHGPQSCPLGHFECMRRITAPQVFEACQRLLGS
jgi:heptosyltransferase-2